MIKGTILPLIAILALAIPTILGVIPAFLGVLVILVIVVVKDMIIAVLSRGLPSAIIAQRVMGGLLWGIWGKTNNVKVARVDPVVGTIVTKESGSFNLIPDRLFKIDGVPMGLAPEGVGYNVGFDHVLFVKELEKRGITNVLEIVDVNEYGQILNFKDDPRITDLKDTFQFKAKEGEPLDLSGFNSFYRYCAEAASPHHQDARVKIGIAQGIPKSDGGKHNWLLYVGALVLLVCLGVGLLMLMKGDSGEQTFRIITDNGGSTVIPALVFAPFVPLGKLKTNIKKKPLNLPHSSVA